MPKGIYIRTEEHNRNISKAKVGIKLTEETKHKIRENAKINPNFGMKGKHPSEETIKKLSESHKGYVMPEEQKRKISESNKGKVGHESWSKGKKGVYSKESLNKMSLAQMGNKNPMFGKRGWNNGLTKETDERVNNISKKLDGRKLSEEHLRKVLDMNRFRKGKTYEEIYGEDKAIKIRKKHSINMSGESHPNWLGGLSFEPYTKEFNKIFKELIRIRDGFLCLKCGIREEDSIILFKRKLTIHHIDYIKSNSIKENCCALCNRCNIEVNANRIHWTKFFQSLLSEIYEYKYNNIINSLDEKVDNIILNKYNNYKEVEYGI